MSNVERLCLDYLKHRFEVGVTYIVPREQAEQARAAAEGRSVLPMAAICDAYFTPPTHAAGTVSGDVAFTIVDARPEGKFVMNPRHAAKENTRVVVRAYSPCTRDGDERVPAAWKLESWDVRAWLQSAESWTTLIGSLLRVIDLRPTSNFMPVRAPILDRGDGNKTPTPGLPPVIAQAVLPDADELAIVPATSRREELAVLMKKIADAVVGLGPAGQDFM